MDSVYQDLDDLLQQLTAEELSWFYALGGGSCDGYQQMSGGEELMLQSESIYEPSLDRQMIDLQDSIEFLENLWLTDPQIQQEIDDQDWQNFMDAVYQSLYELQTNAIQIE
jgi:uncharacterized protein YlaN (UPF0358 family)